MFGIAKQLHDFRIKENLITENNLWIEKDILIILEEDFNLNDSYTQPTLAAEYLLWNSRELIEVLHKYISTDNSVEKLLIVYEARNKGLLNVSSLKSNPDSEDINFIRTTAKRYKTSINEAKKIIMKQHGDLK